MENLVRYLNGYIKLNLHKIMPMLVIGFFLFCIFLYLMRRGYTKQFEKRGYMVICGGLLSLSLASVFVMTLYGREIGAEHSFRLQIFGSYLEVFQSNNTELLLQIIMNVVLFVAPGVLLPVCFAKYEKNRSVFLLALTFSFVIECVQGLTKIGMFEFDDIIGNVLGAEIGFLCYRLIRVRCKRIL